MLPEPGSAEESKLILELMALPGVLQVGPDHMILGSKWIDITCAAALLSPAYYWPRDRRLRQAVKPYPIPPARLLEVTRVTCVTDGRALVKFTLGGRPGVDLKQERTWLYSGMFHPQTVEYRKNLSDLMDIYMDARESARRRFGNLRAEDTRKGDEDIVVATH